MEILFPNETILRTELFDVGQDWETPIPGFFIVAPLRKIRSIAEFTEEEAAEFIKIVIEMRKGMKEVLDIKDVYLFENEDTVHSFHFWMFPRLEWMERFGRKIESVRPIMTYAQESMTDEKTIQAVKDWAEKIRKYMENFKA